MKRYEPIEVHDYNGSHADMDESPTGEYVRYSDLIAAGCLVPVPDGGICKQCKGQGSYVVPVYGAYGDDRYRTDRTDCELCKATGLSIRLVPLAELEAEG